MAEDYIKSLKDIELIKKKNLDKIFYWSLFSSICFLFAIYFHNSIDIISTLYVIGGIINLVILNNLIKKTKHADKRIKIIEEQEKLINRAREDFIEKTKDEDCNK